MVWLDRHVLYFIRVLNYYDLCCSCKKLLLTKVIPQYCIAHPYASLHTISVSLVCANERVYKNNKRNFPQAKLHGKINACLLLNEHSDLYFLLHNNSVHIILFNLTKNSKVFMKWKRRYRWKCAQNRYSGMQIMTAKLNTLHPCHFKWCDSSTNFICCSIHAWHCNDFLPVKFFPKYYLKCIWQTFFICSIKSPQCADKCSKTIFSIVIFLPCVLMCQKRQISLPVG